MAIATAKKALNMNVSDYEADMTFTVTTASHIQITSSSTGKVWDFYGTFTNSATGTTGTFTSMTRSTNGVQDYSITGASQDWGAWQTYAINNDWYGAMADLFSGNDTMNGSSGGDVINGYGGNDTLNGGAGADQMNGGAGNDTYIVDNTGDWIVEDGTGATEIDTVKASVNWSLGANVENLVLTGTAGIFGVGNTLNNKLTGNAGDNYLNGDSGNDTLAGGAGDDWMVGGAGNDTLNGGTNNWADTAVYDNATAGVTVNLSLAGAQAVGGGCGTDTLTGIEGLYGSKFNDTLTGDAGNNMLVGGAGNDTLNGGAGNEDTAAYWDATAGVTVNLSLTGAQAVGGGCGTDTLTGFEQLEGSNFADKLTGDAGGNWIGGGTGNDVLNGAGGNDALEGSAGNDNIQGGAGFDVATFGSATSGVTVNLSLTGAQAVGGGCGTDTLAGIEGLVGSSFNDTLRGNSVSNGLTVKDNWLCGEAGADTIIGGAGNESIAGDLPASALGFVIPTATKWGGKDTLTGGGGADSFVFASLFDSTVGANRDVIKDFVRGTDKIDLSAMDAQTAAGTANDAFTFITGTSFTAAGQVRFANGILYGNTDADATAEFEIALTGITTLAAADLVL